MSLGLPESREDGQGELSFTGVHVPSASFLLAYYFNKKPFQIAVGPQMTPVHPIRTHLKCKAVGPQHKELPKDL